jgi:hypothetical protein
MLLVESFVVCKMDQKSHIFSARRHLFLFSLKMSRYHNMYKIKLYIQHKNLKSSTSKWWKDHLNMEIAMINFAYILFSMSIQMHTPDNGYWKMESFWVNSKNNSTVLGGFLPSSLAYCLFLESIKNDLSLCVLFHIPFPETLF